MAKIKPAAAAAAVTISMAILYFAGCWAGQRENNLAVQQPVQENIRLGRQMSPTPSPAGNGEPVSDIRPAGDTKKLTAGVRTYKVIKVIDGDTIKIDYNGDIESVRLIGVNTPEIHHPSKEVEAYGREAAAFTTKLLAGQRVRLTFDVARRDRYGRLLAYVYLDDGTFVNALLVREGYAQVMTVPPNVKYQALFMALQREARDSRRGLWSLGKYRLENPPN